MNAGKEMADARRISDAINKTAATAIDLIGQGHYMSARIRVRHIKRLADELKQLCVNGYNRKEE